MYIYTYTNQDTEHKHCWALAVNELPKEDFHIGLAVTEFVIWTSRSWNLKSACSANPKNKYLLQYVNKQLVVEW